MNQSDGKITRFVNQSTFHQATDINLLCRVSSRFLFPNLYLTRAVNQSINKACFLFFNQQSHCISYHGLQIIVPVN